MAIDFSFPPEIEQVRMRVRDFCEQIVRPSEKEIGANEGDREVLVREVIKMRKTAQEWGLWGSSPVRRAPGWGDLPL